MVNLHHRNHRFVSKNARHHRYQCSDSKHFWMSQKAVRPMNPYHANQGGSEEGCPLNRYSKLHHQVTASVTNRTTYRAIDQSSLWHIKHQRKADCRDGCKNMSLSKPSVKSKIFIKLPTPKYQLHSLPPQCPNTLLTSANWPLQTEQYPY